MPERAGDWLKQAERDLQHAHHALRDGDYEWAAFAAQQAAEKAVKALYQRLGGEAWGHAVSLLLTHLPEERRPEEALIERAKGLDRHYIGPRYPNSFPDGAPMVFYTRHDAEQAISDATAVIAFCQDQISR